MVCTSEAMKPGDVGRRLDNSVQSNRQGGRICVASGSSMNVSPMHATRAATLPLSQRPRCFLDNDDLGQLGCSSTLLYSVVSVSLTIWAVWDPSVPGGGQWVGSPMALQRAFLANCNTHEEHTSMAQLAYGSHQVPEP